MRAKSSKIGRRNLLFEQPGKIEGNLLDPFVVRQRVRPERFQVAFLLVVETARDAGPACSPSGLSIRLAESFALIWNSTRISNSLNAFRLRKRFTLL